MQKQIPCGRHTVPCDNEPHTSLSDKVTTGLEAVAQRGTSDTKANLHMASQRAQRGSFVAFIQAI